MDLIREYIRCCLLENASLDAHDEDSDQEDLLTEPDDSDEEETEEANVVAAAQTIMSLVSMGKSFV